MKSLYVRAAFSLCLLALVSCGGQSPMEFLSKGPPEARAKKRVSRILEAVRDYGDTTHVRLQIAICLWSADVEHIQNEDLVALAHDRFVAWQEAGQIHPKLRKFTVDNAVKVEGAAKPTYVVSGTIDGRKFAMRVPSGGEIRWERAR